jgi:tetratricopeptide (TPR) repeat protein
MAASRYQEALAFYEQKIAEFDRAGQHAGGALYEKAGRAALFAGDSVRYEHNFKMAVYTEEASPFVYHHLAAYYRAQGNVSKEMMMLEPLEKNFPNSEEAISQRTRLFELGLISGQPRIALDLWPSIPDQYKTEELLTLYLMANRKVGLDDSCNQVANRILKVYPENKQALEWQAIRYYDLAEDRYQREIKAYEANKTNRQYKLLLAELDRSTDDMKQSLNYFNKLWKLDPNSGYATYLHNIYARFGDESKAAYYRKFMK